MELKKRNIAMMCLLAASCIPSIMADVAMKGKRFPHGARRLFSSSSSSSSSSSETCSSDSSSTSAPQLPLSTHGETSESSTTSTSETSTSETSDSSTSSSSTSSSSTPACVNHDVLCNITYYANLNYRDRVPTFEGPGAFVYASVGDYVADDGVLTTGPKGGLLDSKIFTLSAPQNPFPALDHAKYFIYSQDSVPVPENGEFVYENCVGSETFGIESTPFPPEIIEKENDVRLGFGNVLVADLSTGIELGFFLSNDRIYAVYSRLPGLRPLLGNYAAFSHVIPIAKRCPAQIHNLKLVLNSVSKTVSYQVDGKELLVLGKIGELIVPSYLVQEYGGEPIEAFPTQLNFGIGTFDALDFYPVCKKPVHCLDKFCWKDCEYPRVAEALVKTGDETSPTQFNPLITSTLTNATYFDTLGLAENRLFGQGVVMNLQKMITYTKSCYPAA